VRSQHPFCKLAAKNAVYGVTLPLLLNSKEADAVQYRQWEWPLGMITILRPSGYAHHPRGRQQQAAQQEAMQRFMPRNDSVTVAWSFLFGLQRSTSQRSSTSTGLRSRRGHPRLEPDARTNRPIAQLAIYALALTRRVPRPEAL
jgi:hypothetical protein